MDEREALAGVARAWVALWNPPVDRDRFQALHAEDFVDCSSAGRPSDRSGFALGLERMLAAFPDLHTTVEDLVVEPATGKVAVRWRAEGTNRAAYLGVGPTHRRTTITGLELIEVRGGRLVRRWGEWDITGHTGHP